MRDPQPESRALCGLLTDEPCRLPVDHPGHETGCPRQRECRCPVCGYRFPPTVDGRLPHHLRIVDPVVPYWEWHATITPTLRTGPCDGSGQRP